MKIDQKHAIRNDICRVRLRLSSLSLRFEVFRGKNETVKDRGAERNFRSVDRFVVPIYYAPKEIEVRFLACFFYLSCGGPCDARDILGQERYFEKR